MDAAVNDALSDDGSNGSGNTSGPSPNGPDNNSGYAGEFDGLGSAADPSDTDDDQDDANANNGTPASNGAGPSLNGPENNFGYAGEFDGLGPAGAPTGPNGTTAAPEPNSAANNFGYQDEFAGLPPAAPTTGPATPPTDQVPGPMVGFVGPVPTLAPPTTVPPTVTPPTVAPPTGVPPTPPPAAPSLLGRAVTTLGSWAARFSPVGVFAAGVLTPTNTQSTTTQINDNTRLAHAPGDLYGRVETQRPDGSWADTGITAAPAYDDNGNVIGLSNPSSPMADEFSGIPAPEIAPPTAPEVATPTPATVDNPTPATVDNPTPATVDPGTAPEVATPTGPNATPPGVTPPAIDPPPDIAPVAPPEFAPPTGPEFAPPTPATVTPPAPATITPATPPQITQPAGPDATPPGFTPATPAAPATPDTEPDDPGLPTPTVASDTPPVDPSPDGDEPADTVDPAIQERYDELDRQGHGPARHGPDVTDEQLRDRAVDGKDPMTGTTTDGVHGGRHGYSKDATKVNSVEDFVEGERAISESEAYRDARDDAIANGRDTFTVDVPLEDVYGPDYQDHVTGVTREGTRNNPTGSRPTDFTDGSLRGVYKIDDTTGEPELFTMYPNPRN